MQTIKQEYRQFLDDNFKGLIMKQPLFYNWSFGLRFDLQFGEPDTDEYFKEVTKRACKIFKTAFDSSDEVFLIFMDYKYKRRKIRLSNFTFKQIASLQKIELNYSKATRIYDSSDRFDVRNIAIIKLKAERINYKNIISAIGHSDFPPRQPSLDHNRPLSSKEIYFVNINTKLIFHMYDDRGLDLISADKKILKAIYKKHKDWLLDYDRKQIDEQLGY